MPKHKGWRGNYFRLGKINIFKIITKSSRVVLMGFDAMTKHGKIAYKEVVSIPARTSAEKQVVTQKIKNAISKKYY